MARLWKIAVSLLSILSISQFKVTPVRAAEKVVLRFGPFTESISLTELQSIANQGEVPKNFKIYTKKLSSEEGRLFVEALKTKIPINVVAASKLLNTRIGTTILKDLNAVIRRKDKAGVQAIRAGVVLGATAPEGFSILNFIAAYPSKRLEIDLLQAFKFTQKLNLAFWRTQEFMIAISPQLKAKNPRLSFPFDPSQKGSTKVQLLELEFTDQKRNRNIPVNIYRGTKVDTEKPLIVFSHGLGSVRTELKYLAKHLASHGYVVAALEHPGSNEANTYSAIQGQNRIVQPEEFLERPRDISFVLDELTKLNQQSLNKQETSKPFKQALNQNSFRSQFPTNKVMVLGYSFGGGTALAIAGGELQLEKLKERCQDNLTTLSLGEGIQCVAQELPKNRYQLRDERVKSVIALNPISSLMFGDTGLSKIKVPTLVLAASADKTTPALTEQIASFTKIPTPKWLVGILGGTHLSLKDPSTTMDQNGKPSTALSGGEVVGEQAKDIRKYFQAIALAFASQLTPEAERYKIFLTSDYAHFASTKAFPFRLITKIPSDAKGIIKNFIDKE
ncbi:alpha/beta hydrolase [Mastigocoleus sp. MO_188.B34]|uniref:alpha/beta hydrolase n=1 Tax=Mastigocoleus sp. MO_188.B34 TaxID=3036635 RepID=UPI002633BDC7|nr:alpha/beta hydrolase [Mastigocoleus sp. MO_188.B34]MDJ0694306.1 alpha/beta hydrolase [Mastigocoleus sp. MO_188.B34]